jgi:DNA-binding NarL/FixJ family response regulator
MRILLVDDHALFRGGLKYLLRGLDDSIAMDEAGDCPEALERLGAAAYDLVLLDLKLPGVNGFDALASLRDAAPGTPLIVLSGEDDPSVVHATIERGAMGFIPKSSTPEVMIQAMRLVLARGVYLPPAALDAVRPGASAALPELTPRQIDVMRCVIRGKPNKTIARELEVSEATVKAHLTAVFQALGARNRTEAVYVAAKLGLRFA